MAVATIARVLQHDGSAGCRQYSQRVWSLGELMQAAFGDAGANFASGRKYVWECSTAGDSAGTSAPTWPASVTPGTTTVTCGAAVFTARNPNAASDWSYPMASMHYAGEQWGASQGRVLVHKTHSETWASINNTAFGGFVPSSVQGLTFLCVDKNASDAESTGAAVVQTGSTNTFYVISNKFRNISFNIGANAPRFIGNEGVTEIDGGNITFTYNGSMSVLMGGGNNTTATWFKNLTVTATHADTYFSNTGFGQPVLENVDLVWPTASAGSLPLFNVHGSFNAAAFIMLGGSLVCHVNKSLALARSIRGGLVMDGVKLPASFAGWPTAQGLGNGVTVNAISRCGSAAADAAQVRQVVGMGDISTELTTKVAGDGVNGTDQSLKMVTHANATVYDPCVSAWSELVNTATGAARYLDVDITSEVDLKDNECWAEALVLTDASSPKTTLFSGRADSMAAGSSLPAGSAAWTAGKTHTKKARVGPFTPQLAGVVLWRLVCGKASTTLYIKPTPGIVAS